jgi:hypothetical protein
MLWYLLYLLLLQHLCLRRCPPSLSSGKNACWWMSAVYFYCCVDGVACFWH